MKPHQFFAFAFLYDYPWCSNSDVIQNSVLFGKQFLLFCPKSAKSHKGRRQRRSRGHHTSGVTISYPGAEIGKAVKVPSKDPVNCRLVPNWTSMALDKILWDKTTTMYNMALFGSEYLEYYVDVSNNKNYITFSHSSPVQRP